VIGHIHGKNAAVYIGAGGGEAIQISEQVDYSIDTNTPFPDISSLNQTWTNAVKGMLSWSGTCNGNFNLGSTQLWLAHLSDVPEKMYIYPTISSPTQYYYGTAWITLTKALAGSTTAKSSGSFKFQGDGALSIN
jgi:hypothetical protein